VIGVRIASRKSRDFSTLEAFSKKASASAGGTGYASPKCLSSMRWAISIEAAAFELLEDIQSR